MTTLLTITTAILAVCAVALGWRCVRLRKELKEANEDAQWEVSDAKRELCRVFENVCDNPTRYFGFCNVIDGTATVCRDHNIGGKFYRVIIKRFTDPDADFNQREAEELLDKLNEK